MVGPGAVDAAAIEALRAESDAAPQPADPRPDDFPDPESGELPEPEPAMVGLCEMMTKVSGRIICKRFGVPQLDASERSEIGRSLAIFCKCWGVEVGDPRIASALMLAGAVSAAALPRMELIEGTAAPAAEAAAVGPA